MHTDLRDSAEFIISNFKNHYINKEGLISIQFPPNNKLIFNNFDDIVPFFLYFNEHDFLLSQIKILRENYSFEKILAVDNVLYSFKIDEYLGGLYHLWKETSNNNAKRLIDEGLRKIKKFFIKNDNLFGTYDLIQKKASDFYFYWSSGLLEVFLEMSSEFPGLKEITLKIIDSWINNPYFEKYGLFPFRWSDKSLVNSLNLIPSKLRVYSYLHPPTGQWSRFSYVKSLMKAYRYKFLTSGQYTILMKSNTTFIFTLISLYDLTKDVKYKHVIEKWIDNVTERLIRDDIVYGHFYPHWKISDNTLTNSFIIIDVLMDTYFYVEKDVKYLEIAKRIIDKQLSLRWSNGLIPQHPNSTITDLDNLIDFSVSIRRFAELSNQSSYFQYCEDLILNLLKYHKGQNGLVQHVNEDNEPIYHNRNTYPPKYNGLALKGIINLLTIDERIYENPKLHSLFNDR